MTMSPKTNADLFECIRTQARLRMKLGFPVCILMLLCIWQWGPSLPAIGAGHVIPLFALYILYNLGILHLTHSASRLLNARHVLNFTAVMDPLLLSAGLVLMGQTGQLFVCFYLFIILGFGFRVSPDAMLICQTAAVVGFVLVTLISPVWQAHQVIVLSVLFFLLVIPFYARSFIRLRMAYDRAESDSQAKTRLLADISHELRTPLTGIVSSAQLMREENEDHQVRKRADTILTLSRELMAQINDLLDSAKYGAGALQLEIAPFRMRDIAEQLRMTLAPTALAKGIKLQVSMDERIPAQLLGDAHHLGRVLLNLGGNAVKFTDHGEVLIRITLLDENDRTCHLLLNCRDTGIGIAPELHHKIFEPFFQASAGTNRKYGGTGLGMSIARDIVTRMGGVMRVQSTLGKGSLFEFDLWVDKLQTSAPEQRADNTGVIVRDKRILLADDNATNLLLTKELLERDGHRVLTAVDGRSAIDLLSSSAIDLAFLDFNMGDIDGATVLQIYRFGKLNPAPTYILTADATADTARRLMNSGATGVLHKPVDIDTLRQTIRYLFAAALPSSQAWSKPCVGGCIDECAIAGLKELDNDSGFLGRVLNTAVADIETLCNTLVVAVRKRDLAVVRDRAHALMGISISISVGAVQLCAIATHLAHLSHAELWRDSLVLAEDIATVSEQSIVALRNIVRASAN
jgi:two-component system, sensor histidine kinase RpfC